MESQRTNKLRFIQRQVSPYTEKRNDGIETFFNIRCRFQRVLLNQGTIDLRGILQPSSWIQHIVNKCPLILIETRTSIITLVVFPTYFSLLLLKVKGHNFLGT